MEPVFAGNDLRLMQSLIYDASLEPAYEYLKGCLVWRDERPDDLTPAAYENLSSLWIARSLLHRGLDFSDDPINPEFTREIWNRAIQQIPDWPGFKRISLSKKDAEYYEHEMKLAAEGQYT